MYPARTVVGRTTPSRTSHSRTARSSAPCASVWDPGIQDMHVTCREDGWGGGECGAWVVAGPARARCCGGAASLPAAAGSMHPRWPPTCPWTRMRPAACWRGSTAQSRAASARRPSVEESGSLRCPAHSNARFRTHPALGCIKPPSSHAQVPRSAPQRPGRHGVRQPADGPQMALKRPNYSPVRQIPVLDALGAPAWGQGRNRSACAGARLLRAHLVIARGGNHAGSTPLDDARLSVPPHS